MNYLKRKLNTTEKKKNIRLNLKERIQITKRGYSILGEYCPGLVRAKVLSAFIEAILPFVTIWFSARIINEIASFKRIEKLIEYVAIAILINFIIMITKSVIDKIIGAKESSMWDCFSKIFSDKQMTIDYVDLENVEYQNKKQRAEENLFMFGNGLGQLVWNTPSMVKMMVSLIASFALTLPLFLTDSSNKWLDSPIWMAVLLLLMIIEGFINNVLKDNEQKVFEKWSEGTVWFNRAFAFYGQELDLDYQRAKDVRIYEQEKVADREISKLINHNLQDDKYITKMSAYQGINSFIAGLLNVVCYIFVVLKAFLGAFGVGFIVQYVSALMLMTKSFGEITLAKAENHIYCEHLKKLYEYLDLPNRKKEGTLSVDENLLNKKDQSNLSIEFKNVSFKYPKSDEYTLKNINVKINAGKKCAIVGANGSGKTTFIKLLCGLYEPTEGEILLNGVNIKEYNYEEYLKMYSLVFQDFKLFSFSIGQNISTNIEYNSEKVLECMKKSGIYDRYKTMSERLDTCLFRDFSESGVEISGGEAQKIALARALYKDAPLMVLDEPTAALDPIAEAEIYSKFNGIVGEKTTIYVSHRLSSCKFCDAIMVFNEGEIVQSGTHDELVLDNTGKYYELWEAQANYYQKTDEEQ